MNLFKKIIPFCFAVLFCGTIAWGQCPQEDVILQTQAQVDSFGLIYPDCTELAVSLNIGDWSDIYSIVDLEPLSEIVSIEGDLEIIRNYNLVNWGGFVNVTSVGGNLMLSHNGFANLSGLSNITSVGGDLMINGEDVVNLDGLNSITTLGGDLLISYNNYLTNLVGLDNLTSLNGNLEISDNHWGLINLTGIESLTSIEGNLLISNNFDLESLEGLNNLASIGGYFEVHKSAISDLSGLDNLVTVDSSLIINYNGDLVNCDGLNNLSSVGNDVSIVNNHVMVNLIGLEGITEITGNLTIAINYEMLDFSGLDNLTTIEGNFYVGDNNDVISLSGLGSLTSIGGYFDLKNNHSLYQMSDLENLTSVGDYFQIRTNRSLIDLNGLGSLASVDGYFEIYKNEDLVNFNSLNNLTSIGGKFEVWKNESLLTIDGLENLTTVEGQLRISGNDNLSDISSLENIDHNLLTGISITSNPLLSNCSILPVCSYLFEGGSANINYNASGCNDVVEILSECPTIPKIQTNVFYDINQDKLKDENEFVLNNISLSLEPDSVFFFSQSSGVYYVREGSHVVSFREMDNPNWGLTTDSTSYFLSLEEGEIDTTTFGIYPTQQISHIETIINSAPMRCNETIALHVTTTNLGTTIASGTMWLLIDDVIPAYNFIDEPDIVIADFNAYGWNFTDLYPGQTLVRNVLVMVPGPPGFPVGEQLLFVSFSEFTDANGEDDSEGFRYNPEVRCSFDPNDKLVHPNRNGDYVLFEEDLFYTIRFQNTGNDVAYHVVIQDTLDANLDLSTFRLLGTSHADVLNTSMNDEGELTFEFNYIFLPDSTSNLEGSQGYVSYLISPIDGLAEETLVTNSAGIYFDFNPPVITNTTQSIMVSELPSEAHCLPNDVILRTQFEVDNFANIYPDCTKIYGSLQIGSESIVSDIDNVDALSGIASIEGSLRIIDNPDLMNLGGLKNIDSIGASLEINDNDNLLNLNGLGKLTTIGSHLIIANNGDLMTLNGINNLSSSGGDIIIHHNTNLSHLTDLESLTSMSGTMRINDNLMLNSLVGIENIPYDSISLLLVYENPLLSYCHVSNICDYLVNDGSSTIHENLTYCNSVEDVLLLCTVSNDTPEDLSQITISPNPTNGTFTLQGIPEGTYQIHNTSGQIIQQGDMQNDLLIDMSSEVQGVYFISVTVDDATLTRRIVKI